MRDLTNYEYDALVALVTETLKNKPGWGDGYESSVGQTLIQLMADVTDNLHFMLERRSQEAFITTARLYSSIVAHSSELGYRPRRKVSNTGTVTLTLFDEDDNIIPAQGQINIPAGTPVTGVDENFVTISDALIAPGETSVDIAIKEGVTVTEEFNFNLDPYKTERTILIEDFVDIEEYSLKVFDQVGDFKDITSSDTVNRNITSLSYALPDEALYDIKYAVDGMRIIFGDNEFGKKPIGTVRVEWVKSKGDDVETIFSGRDFSFESEFLFDDVAVNPPNAYRYTMTNITPIRGGLEEESIKEIARNAPIFTRTANRAVTNADFEFLGLRSGIGDIADISSFGEHELRSLIYKMNNVYLSYITTDAIPLNIEQKRQLLDYLNNFKIVTTHIVLQEANRVDAIVDIKFKRNPSLPITDTHLYQVLKEYIEDYFALRRGSIGREIQHSEFVRYLQNREFRFNGVLYDLADFVKVDITAQYEIVPLQSVYDVLINIEEYKNINAGDEWTIGLDGVNYTVTVEFDDTQETLTNRMRQTIFENTDFLTAVEDGNLRIKSPYIDDRFDMDLTQGYVSKFVKSDIIYQIPTKGDDVFDDGDSILPGSATLVDENEVVLYEDNSNGNMVGVNETAPFGIDYKKAQLLSPPFDPDVKYYLRYKQNVYQNIGTDKNSAVVLSPIAETFFDTPLYSRLELI